MFDSEERKQMVDSIEIDRLLEDYAIDLSCLEQKKDLMEIKGVKLNLYFYDNKIDESNTLSLILEDGNNGQLVCLRKEFECFSCVGIKYDCREQSDRFFKDERSLLLFILLCELVEIASFDNLYMEEEFLMYSAKATVFDKNGESIFESDAITPEMIAVFKELYGKRDMELPEVWYNIDFDSIIYGFLDDFEE